MFALQEAYRSKLFARGHWLNNLIAGVIVGVVALPLAMAFAIASGVKPEQGIYTAIIAGLAVSLFGGCRLQIAGPTGAFIVVLSAITAEHGVAGLQLATLMAGVILLLLGLVKMGSVIKFIPAPVIIGFTSGIAIIIWVSQWQDFLGLPQVEARHFHQKLYQLITLLPQAHLNTSILAILSLALVIYGPKLPLMKRIPGPLIALIAATLLQLLYPLEGVKTIGTAFGGLPSGLPQFSLPEFHLEKLIQLVGPAFTIAMLGAIESLLSAVVADGMTGNRHNSNQELVGQGIANILAPLFGGFAATGAIARTATNIRNGGTSPLAGMTHAVVLILILLFMAPWAVHIPMATLSAILFVVAWNMSEARHFVNMLRQAPKADIAILLTTFLLTLLVDLVVAVNIGVILAILLFIRRMAASVEVRENRADELQLLFSKLGIEELPAQLLIFTVEGPFFFAAVESLERSLANIHQDPETLIIRLNRVPFIDITGLQRLSHAISALQKRGVNVLLSEPNAIVRPKLLRAGISPKVGSEHIYTELETAVREALHQVETL